MPVGDGDHAVARGFEADFSLVQTLPRTKPNTARGAFGDEQLGVARHVGRGEIARAIAQLAENASSSRS
jgi:hypothetical protein